MTSYIFTTLVRRVPRPRLRKVVCGVDSLAIDNSVRTGNGSITGRVTENGLPVSRRVMLYDRNTGAYAGQTRSDSEGIYSFDRTNEQILYFAVSIDDDNDGVQYNIVGQDLISGNHDARIAP